MLDPTRLGTVVSVTGSAVYIELAPETISGLVFVGGQGYRVGQVGSFVKIPQGYGTLYGVVTQAGVAAAPTPELASEPHGRRWLTAELVGEGQPGGAFERGVAQYPTLGDAVHLVTEDDLRVVYGQVSGRDYVDVGHLASARSVPAYVEVNRLITRHSAVLGATGSGKSTTVAGLLHRLTDPERFPAARVLILDIHGEYASAFGDRANVYRVAPNAEKGELPLFVPFWALTFDELLALTFGELDDTSRGYIQDEVTQRKKFALGHLEGSRIGPSDVTPDTPVPFSLHQLWYDVHFHLHATVPGGAEKTDANASVVEAGDAQAVTPPRFQPNDGKKFVATSPPLNMRRQTERLASRLRDPRLSFMFRPGPWAPDGDGHPERDLSDLLRQWLGGNGRLDAGPDGSLSAARPVTILDLSGAPTSILTELIGALLRMLHDAIFWARGLSEGGRERPLLVVMEEAHSYLSDGTAPAAQAVKRIVKEGRKYGIGAMIVSQRPAEVDQTILSQCGTLFAMRLSNATDRNHIASAMSDNMKGLLEMVPTLRTGEAIIVGEAVRLPTRALIRLPPAGRRPDSQDPRVVEVEFAPGESGPGGWDRHVEPADYKDTATVWRRQDPTSPRLSLKVEDVT